VKTKTWQDLLQKNGWSDVYLPGDAFKTYLDKEITQTEEIISKLGLAKK
jgi:putative tricarboxylic transport membrane protein